MNTKRITLILNTACLGCLVSCSRIPKAPEAKAKNAREEMQFPTRFDTKQVPVPEIAQGLMSLFADPTLTSHVKRALRSNPNLQFSLARLEEAGFNTRKANAPRLPSLTANGTASRGKLNGTSTGTYSGTLDSQWEIDVWGHIRAGVQAASLNEASLASEHEAARQSIAAQTMQAYFAMISAEKLLELSERRLQSFKKSVTLVNRRFEAGTGNLADVDLARTDLENARAQVNQRKNSRDQAARTLASLTGQYPNAKVTANTFPSLKKNVPPGIPSTVMLKRPDLNAAYLEIRAADAQVTIAHRDLYPRFPLTASVGKQSSQLKKLLDSNFSVWSIASNFTAPLFDGGSRRSELGAANARAKQALASYRSTVLRAMQEVENALGSEYYLRKQQVAYQNALKAAQNAETQTQRNYENGLVEILTLLDAQRRSFNTEESLIQTTALRFQNRVSLALALGKGL